MKKQFPILQLKKSEIRFIVPFIQLFIIIFMKNTFLDDYFLCSYVSYLIIIYPNNNSNI